MARRKKPEDPPEDSDKNDGNDDTFGLPEIEYEPLNREKTPEPEVRATEPEPEFTQPEYTEEQPITHTTMEQEEVRQNEYTSTYYEEDEGNSPWPKILGIALVVVLAGVGAWWWFVKKPANEAAARERIQQEEQARTEAARIEERRLNEQRLIAEEANRKADSVANAAVPVTGSIETLNERTGRYYVVVASAIDGDLLMDYAKKLSEKGINAKIIAPFGNVKFHRLTVAEAESFASAAQTAEGLKGEYTESAWVIKY